VRLPHGGELVDRRFDADEVSALASGGLASLPLTAAEAADLRALATGAYSPLVGFMGAKEHQSVTEAMRLPDGTLWSIPVCLAIPNGMRVPSGRLALRGPAGQLLGILEGTEVFDRDRVAEAELVYGTSDPGRAPDAVLDRPAAAWGRVWRTSAELGLPLEAGIDLLCRTRRCTTTSRP
jgi:sulfate adenylyltransferase